MTVVQRKKQTKDSTTKKNNNTTKNKNQNKVKGNNRHVQDDRLFTYDKPVHSWFLAVFRICWGMIMWMEIWSYISSDYAKMNLYWYSNPIGFRFQYWIPFCSKCVVPLIEQNEMKIFLWFMIFLCFCIIIGLFYRIVSILFFFGFTYLFLLDATWYLNHIYLCILVCILFIILPSNCYWSIDAYLFPSVKSDTCPR